MTAMRRARIPVCVLGIACLLVATMALAADRFVTGIADLPLMPGLEEIADSATVFSKPEGRIVEVAARGSVAADAVRRFYDQTLPQLGWHHFGAQGWQRENEVLRLDMTDGKDGLVVQFSLTPQ